MSHAACPVPGARQGVHSRGPRTCLLEHVGTGHLCFAFERRYYSVPFQHVHEEADLRATATTLEAFLKHRRVAAHVRSFVPHGYMTLAEHMPRAHREHAEWTPSRMVAWARKVRPSPVALVAGELLHDVELLHPVER